MRGARSLYEVFLGFFALGYDREIRVGECNEWSASGHRVGCGAEGDDQVIKRERALGRGQGND